MKKCLILALVGSSLALANPALAAKRHGPSPVMNLETCQMGPSKDTLIRGPNWTAVAHVGDVARVATVTLTNFTTVATSSHLGLVLVPAQTIHITILGHPITIVIPAHNEIRRITTTTTTNHPGQTNGSKSQFSVGQYVMTSTFSAVIGTLIKAGMTPCRQLTLSEAYGAIGDGYVPFIFSWFMRQAMPDSPETYRIAKWAKDHNVTGDSPNGLKVWHMYQNAYARERARLAKQH